MMKKVGFPSSCWCSFRHRTSQDIIRTISTSATPPSKSTSACLSNGTNPLPNGPRSNFFLRRPNPLWISSSVAVRTMATTTNPSFPTIMDSEIPSRLKDLLELWFNGWPPSYLTENKNGGDKEEELNEEKFQERIKKWFFGNEEFDEKCRSFLPLLNTLIPPPSSFSASISPSTRELLPTILSKSAAHTSPSQTLALILLLDQVPRNAFRERGPPGPGQGIGEGNMNNKTGNIWKVWSYYDHFSVEVVKWAMESKRRYDIGGLERKEWKYRPDFLAWFYVPLEHSEDMDLHKRGIEEWEGLEKKLMDMKKLEGEENTSIEWKLKATQQFQKFADDHAKVVERFGRYPHRNIDLGRSTTQVEKDWLDGKEGEVPGWATT